MYYKFKSIPKVTIKQNLRYKNTSIVTQKEYTCSYDMYQHDSPEFENVGIVYFPSLYSHKKTCANIAPILAQLATVFSLDYVGRGESDCLQSGDEYILEQPKLDVANFFQILQKEHNIKKFILIGNSAGGFFSLNYMATTPNPKSILGCILLDMLDKASRNNSNALLQKLRKFPILQLKPILSTGILLNPLLLRHSLLSYKHLMNGIFNNSGKFTVDLTLADSRDFSSLSFDLRHFRPKWRKLQIPIYCLVCGEDKDNNPYVTPELLDYWKHEKYFSYKIFPTYHPFLCILKSEVEYIIQACQEICKKAVNNLQISIDKPKETSLHKLSIIKNRCLNIYKNINLFTRGNN